MLGAFIEASNNKNVLCALIEIEDKLLSRGILADATLDLQSEIRIAYEIWGEGNCKPLPFLCIRIDFLDCAEVREDKFEAISDYVNEKIADASREWGAEIRQALSEVVGQVVILNGERVY